jgi:hypothetical protein
LAARARNETLEAIGLQGLFTIAAAAVQPQSDLLSHTPMHQIPARRIESVSRSPSISSNIDAALEVNIQTPRFGEEELYSEIDDSDNNEDDGTTERQLSKAQKRRDAKIQQLLTKKQTPNVHTILHYSDVIREFASTRNVLTFFGESKHR